MAALSFQRKVLLLGVCIAVLAAVYVLGLVFSPARIGKREAQTPLLSDFNRRQRDQVVEISISSDEGSLSLLKQEESWVLPGTVRDYPASQARIDSFLDFLADLARTRVITENPEAWEEFQVEAESSRRIHLFAPSSRELAEIIVGKSVAGGEENYVRIGGSNEVLLLNRSFSYYLSVEEKFWAYLRVFPEDLEGQSIMRLTVDSTLELEELGSEPLQYTLVLSSEQPAVWKLVDGPEGSLENSTVDLLVGNLADLAGTEFAHGVSAEQAGLSDPAARILISTIDDRDFRLLIGGPAGDDQYYVALENGSFIYKVSAWRIKGIVKKVEDLRKQSGE